jgi:hypothetical protein
MKGPGSGMMLVCAVCQRYLGTKPPYRDLTICREMCTPCTIQARRDLSTLVVSSERGDALPVLESLLRGGLASLRVLIDRRKADRRKADLRVEVCRRGLGQDRRQTRSLRIV